MKILIASDSYKFQTSGASNVVIAHAAELRRRGHDVKVLALSDTKRSFKDGDDYYIGSHAAHIYPDARYSFVLRNRLLRELKDWKPDVVHIHTEFSVARMARAIAAANNTPIVMTSHTDYGQFLMGRYSGTLPARMLCRSWGRYAFHGAKVVTTPSEKALSFPQLGAVTRRTVVIPNGIPLEQYQKSCPAEEKAALFEQCGFTDNGKTLAIISRMSREKNIREILSYFPTVLERIPDAQLLIVGDGPEREHLEQLSRELGIAERTCFTGRIPPEDVYRYYNMGDVFVSASTFEVHSLTYLEALARGLPLVCREDPCLRGVLKEGENGYAYRTEQEFVDSVVQILSDPELHRSMREKALETAADFSVERFADRMLALYETVLRKTRAS